MIMKYQKNLTNNNEKNDHIDLDRCYVDFVAFQVIEFTSKNKEVVKKVWDLKEFCNHNNFEIIEKTKIYGRKVYG